MSLRRAIASGVAAAFKGVGDIKVSIDYYSADVQDPLFNYDTRTGDKIQEWTVIPNVIAILVQANQSRLASDADWLIKPGDQVAIIQQRDLLSPMQSEDQMMIQTRRWRIVNYKADPAGATFIAQIRLTSAEPIMGQGSGSATTGPMN